jgi:hypothetical protein
MTRDKISLGWQGVPCSEMLQQFDGTVDDSVDFSKRLEEGSAALIGVSGEVNCDVFAERLARREEVVGCESVHDPVLF